MTQIPLIEASVARLIVDLDYDALPPEAIAGARRLMQDQLAMQIGCASLPWSQKILGMARAHHVPGTASIAATDDKMSAPDAALVNGSYGHGFEYDDAHRSSSSHPGSCVVPAALALGEELGSSMKEVILGIIAGYEVYTRIGKLASPELLERGFHPHAHLSNFGAAAVVAKMHGFDTDTTLNALSIAMSHVSGTTEYTSSGGSVKRVHAGIGTRNGMIAAQMAAAGITGPVGFLTGNKGYYKTFLQKQIGDNNASAFAVDAPFEIDRIWIKPYCCCGINHAYIDGARQLTDQAQDVEKITLGIQSGGDVVIGNKNENAYAPKIIEHLQYSLPFQFALAILGKGNGFETHHAYMNGRLDLSPGSEVAQMAQKVEILRNPDLDTQYPGMWVADITLTKSNGESSHIFLDNPLGTAENPVSESDLDAKFRDLTEGAMGAERSAALLAAIKHCDAGMQARDLAAMITA